MPFTESQHKLFAWAGANPEAAKSQGYNIPQQTAVKMMGEGIKKPKKLAAKNGTAVKHLGLRRRMDRRSQGL